MTPLNIGDQQVLEHMNKLLASPLFKASQILCDFLKYIVVETIHGRGNFLKEYTVGVNALVKKDFNPQSDASVRIHAGRLRRLLNQYYQTEGKQETIRIVLPKGTYVPVFQLARDTETDSDFYTPPTPTVAVIPFSVMEPSGDAPIAEGLSNQISTDLTAFSELSVISYFSSRKLASQETDPAKIGEILDASYLITGNVQTIGSRIRINVQLTSVKKMQQIWANTYERNREDLDSFTIMDDIVKHVVNQIAGTHGILIRHLVKIPSDQRLLDINWYDAVFWYYYLVNEVNELNEEVFRKALHSIRVSVESNKHSALNWAILSETYVAGYFFKFNCETEDPLKEAVRCGQTALQLDARCDHAYQSLCLAWLFRKKKEECIRTAEQWMSLNSNMAGVQGGIGFCLICCGEFEKGYSMLNDSIQLNPFYQWWFNAGLSIYYFNREEWDEACYWAQKMQPRHIPWALILMTAAASKQGKKKNTEMLREELQNHITMQELKPAIYSFILDDRVCEKLYESIRKP